VFAIRFGFALGNVLNFVEYRKIKRIELKYGPLRGICTCAIIAALYESGAA